MPSSKVPCLNCSTLVSKSNITHLCRPCYLLSRRLHKQPQPFLCLPKRSSPIVIHGFESKVLLESQVPSPSGITTRSSKITLPQYSDTKSDLKRTDVIQPRQYSHRLNFFDQLPHDLLLYISKYLQLDMQSYLIDERFANLVKRVYADLGELICVTSRLFPLSDKNYTLVCKMQWSMNRIRCIFDSYICRLDSNLLTKLPTHYYYGKDLESTSTQISSRIDYTKIQRTGRRKARTIPIEARSSIVEAITNLQTTNRIIIGFDKGDVQKLPKSNNLTVLKTFPKYLKYCNQWIDRMAPHLYHSTEP